MSNYAAPPQLVENVPYRDIGEMHRFARTWRDRHRGQWFTVPKLSGFCLLMKRAVYEAIGGLDERFGLGFFDDDDLAHRARHAGFELAVAHDLFVHHFGSRTFAGNGIDAEKLLDENAGRFAAKWGLNGTNGRRVALKPFQNSNGGAESREISRKAAKSAKKQIGFTFESAGAAHAAMVASETSCSSFFAPLRLGVRSSSVDSAHPPDLAERPRVSLTMIVRDEENNIPSCLESVRGLFDEIVVVDTGSTDRTAEIARSFGARVFDFVWVDDFAAARNAALARATGDYAFWLDADDVVEPDQRQKLEAILKRLRKGEESAYVVRCACDPGPDGSGGDMVVDHIRLFPLREGVRWTYRVHEQILPALRRANIPVQWTDFTVRHTGYVDQSLRSKKLDRDTRILIQELDARPDDPFTLFNLGAIAGERKDWNAALGFLHRSLAGSAPTDSIVRKLYALIARAHQMLGDSPAALQTCAEGLQLDAGDAELWFRKAVVHRHRGEPGEAEQCWRRILHCKRPDQFCSVDQGIYGHLTRRNLAALAAERGDHAEVERLWREVLAECPGDREALAKLNGARGAQPAAPANPDSFTRSARVSNPAKTRDRRSPCPRVDPESC
jgi:GT2 family glycosyltransferase